MPLILIYIYTHNRISAMISKMFIVLYILVQIYFRLALCLYLEQGIYLLHSVLSFYSFFFWGGGGGVMQWYQFTHFVAVV